MRKISLIFAALVLIGGLSAVSFAQTTYHHGRYRRYNINKRQENQQDRIAQGIKSGELTSREASRLENQETRLNRIEARKRASGGRLTYRERGQLERDLNRESRQIYRQKHDRQIQPH